MPSLPGLISRYFSERPKVRRFVTRLLERDRDATVSILGAPVRINTIQEHGYLRASRFMRINSFARDEISVLLSLAYLLPEADAFVDAGANVGVFSAVLAKFRQARPFPIYAFEPNPATCARLRDTAAAVGFQAFECALSDREGVLEFVSGAVSHVFATAENRSEYTLPGATVAVPCRRLDSFPIDGRRMILKIDVEGHEWPVLQGASAFFDQDRVLACYVDGFKGGEIPEYLGRKGFVLRDGRSFAPCPKGDCYSLLAVKRR